jgi:hypothetical protein
VDTILYVCNKGLTTAGLAQFIKSHGPMVGRHRGSLEFRRSSVHGGFADSERNLVGNPEAIDPSYLDIIGDLIAVSERC